MTIEVKNVRSCSHGEYVGRACYGRAGSPLGNPFKVGRDGARGECVVLYERWLAGKIDAGERAVVTEMERLARVAREKKTLTLLCWCAPAACHADVIAHALRERYGIA